MNFYRKYSYCMTHDQCM